MNTLYERMGGAEAVEALVEGFYTQARHDPLLGPVFERAGAPDVAAWWNQHLPKMVRFWTTIAGGLPGYHGNPPAAHQGFDLEPQHFDRWLRLWAEVLEAQLPLDCAQELYMRAGRMRAVIERHLGLTPGLPLRPQPTPEVSHA